MRSLALVDKLVTIARFTDYIQAELAKQQLDGSGIKAVITGQNVANVYSGLPFVGGSIQLQVAEDQAQEALEILNSQSEGSKLRSNCPRAGTAEQEKMGRRPMTSKVSGLPGTGSWFHRSPRTQTLRLPRPTFLPSTNTPSICFINRKNWKSCSATHHQA
ncbi:MAG: putative signal transducing protein [Planctomycetota bacterium]